MMLTRIIPITLKLSIPAGRICQFLEVDQRTFSSNQHYSDESKKSEGSYSHFLEHQKVELQRTEPSISYPAILCKTGRLWHQHSLKEEKARTTNPIERKDSPTVGFQHQCKPETKAQQGTHAHRKKRPKRKLIVEKPKSPGDAFTVFLDTQQRGDSKLKEFLYEMAVAWKRLPEEEKKVYYKKSRILQMQYKTDLLSWEVKMRQHGREDLVSSHRELTAWRNQNEDIAEEINRDGTSNSGDK